MVKFTVFYLYEYSIGDLFRSRSGSLCVVSVCMRFRLVR